jgi:hypothetical protein
MSRRTRRQGDAAADKRLFYISLGVFALAVIAVIVALGVREGERPVPVVFPTSDSAQRMTLEPGVVANYTAVPPAAPAVLTELATIRQQVEDCPDYSSERRGQMQTHFAFMTDPGSIPRDLLPAFGANLYGRIVYGMASYTSIEWRLAGRPQPSCLLEIGQALNQTLTALGEAPLPEFEG